MLAITLPCVVNQNAAGCLLLADPHSSHYNLLSGGEFSGSDESRSVKPES